jgi:RNA polymerase primary sigma factor
VAIARKCLSAKDDLAELVSEGNMALLRAVEGFDVSRGLKFSTYAWPAIENAIRRRGSVDQKYRNRFGVEFDPAMETGDGGRDKRQTHEQACAGEVARIVASNTAGLTPIELAVIGRRYGLGGAQAMTLSEVSRSVGRTRERVRQIQNQALEKIKQTLQSTYIERNQAACAA